MPRSLPAAVSGVVDDTDGVFVYRILEMQASGAGSPTYYSDRVLTTGGGDPVTTAAQLVMSWGNITSNLREGKIGGHSSLSFSIKDPTNALGTAFAANSVGISDFVVRLWVWLPDDASTFSADAILEFDGRLSESSFSEEDATWELTAEDQASQLSKDIGVIANGNAFSDLGCSESNRKILPVVYGAPVARVPMTLVDQPGRTLLGADLTICASELTIPVQAGNAGFTTASTIQLAVGVPGNYEIIRGSFANDAATTFTFSDTTGNPAGTPSTPTTIPGRSRVLFKGSSTGTYAEGGVTYLAIHKNDLPDPSDPGDYRGYLIAFPTLSCATYIMADWIEVGSDTRAILRQPTGVTFPAGGGLAYIVINGAIPVWRTGVQVYEVGAYTFCASHLPVASVTRVEGMIAQGDAGDQVFATLDSGQYTTTLNNKTYNTSIGRLAGDDGITTIALSKDPFSLGFIDGTVFATVSTTIKNAIDVIEDLLFNEFNGGLSTSLKDTTAFTAAKAAISRDVAFALTEVFDLDKTVSDIAMQAGAALIWDLGKAVPIALTATPASGGTAFDQTHMKPNSLTVTELSRKDTPNQIEGSFKFTIPGIERRVIRVVAAAVTAFGENKHKIDVWAFQSANEAGTTAGFWLEYKQSEQRQVEFTAFMKAASVRVGDSIAVSYTAASQVMLPAIDIRVTKIERLDVTDGVQAYRITGTGKLNTVSVASISSISNCDDNVAPIITGPGASDYLADSRGILLSQSQVFARPDVAMIEAVASLVGAGYSGVRLGKTDAAVTAGNTVTVSQYDPGSAGGSESDLGTNITCFSRVDIDSGMWVNYLDRGSYYECFPLECNA